MEDTEEWKYEQGRLPSSPSWYRNPGEEDMVEEKGSALGEEKGQKEEELADRDTQRYLSTGLYRQGSKGGV